MRSDASAPGPMPWISQGVSRSADYYAISSTFQFSPGMVVLHSKDLVNWSILSHAVPDITQISPALNWNRMDRYGKGIWAGAIRYHNKRFWIYFGTPDEGYFMTSAAHAAGPWTPLHLVIKESGWDDCCPFWDEDGQGYLIGTHFNNNYKTYLFRLSADGREIVTGSGKLLNEGLGREANKLFKINGWYYHFFSEHYGSTGRYVMMQRSRTVQGPYNESKQLSHPQLSANEPNQGGIVQTEQGDWLFLTQHGTGAWEGRAASLLPVTWIDGWPILGKPGADGIGEMVWSGKKPVMGHVSMPLQTSDEFDTPTLAVQWEWNYQPRVEKWSLTERPGWLRLHAFQPLETDNLLKAGNTLTQRSLRVRNAEVVILLDLRGLQDGQKAGMCHFSGSHSAIGIGRDGATCTLEYRKDGKIVPGPTVSRTKIWLRSTWGLDGKSQYSYSDDGKKFVRFGDPYPLAWGHYRGDRIGIYSFNNKSDSGYVDVDFFHYTYASPFHRSESTR